MYKDKVIEPALLELSEVSVIKRICLASSLSGYRRFRLIDMYALLIPCLEGVLRLSLSTCLPAVKVIKVAGLIKGLLIVVGKKAVADSWCLVSNGYWSNR